MASARPRNSELFEGEVIEEHDDYKVVRYPASKWVCTSKVEDLTQDKFKDWQQKYPNGMMAMTSSWGKGDKEKSMFKRLYKYIVGVNSEAAEIQMTSPVTKLRKPVEGSPTMEHQEMCFWTGSPWADKVLPQPIREGVYLQEREEMDVFVRRFSGYALSHDDWMQHKEKLEESLKGRDDVDMENGFYTAGYNSPFDLFDRRNEVWIPRMKKQVEKSDTSDAEPSYGKKEEAISYKVVEKTDVYELRQYPSSKWVCTSEVVDPTKDPMNGWEDKYRNPFEAMGDEAWRDSPTSKMFMKMFKYISGVNVDTKEIAMTVPVTTQHIAKDDGTESQTMCFWLGTPWQNTKPPAPLDKTVFIQNREAIEVYVKVFGGYALSNDDYFKQYEMFKKDLTNKSTKDGVYYSLGYNSPWETKNRRNEIWLEKA